MRVLIIDDHPLVRKGLISVLSLEADIDVVGEAGNEKEALKQMEEKSPDLSLVDLRLGDDYGLDVIREARNKGIQCKYVVLTSIAKQEEFRKAEEAGAHGYVLKEAFPDELLYAIRLVGRGRKYYDPGLMEEVMSSKTDKPLEELTHREKEVLVALGEGLCNKEIAKKLFITESTIKKHVSQILAKLELADRTQAALYAYSKGIIT